jgi:hypothetical protein
MSKHTRLLVLCGIILLAAMFRLIGTGLPNVSPVAAIALFGGAYLTDRKWAFILPFAALLLSDLFLGFHDTMWAVYLSFAAIVLIGMRAGRILSPVSVVAGSMSGSILFFLVTNFAVWLGSGYYAQDMSGLAHSYAMGIPFFHYTLLGDLFFNGVLFGGMAWLSARFPALAEARA